MAVLSVNGLKKPSLTLRFKRGSFNIDILFVLTRSKRYDVRGKDIIFRIQLNLGGGGGCGCQGLLGSNSSKVLHSICIGDTRGSLTHPLQANLDMTDSIGPGKLVRHMQNPSYTCNTYLDWDQAYRPS